MSRGVDAGAVERRRAAVAVDQGRWRWLMGGGTRSAAAAGATAVE